MATPIKPKRSYTATNVPSGLSAGELAVNAADGKVWIGSSDGKSNVLISSLSLSDMAGTTSNVTEGSNLYYTDSRARLSLSAGTGISYDNKIGAITNSSPDQTVVLTAGTGISTSGTYPNFTITNSSPDQTVKLTSGTGISVTGTYPNFTITNSSPSSGGTVTSVGLTAPTGMKVTGSPVTGSGTLALAMDTGYALPTTASQTNWDSAYTQRLQWDGGSTNLVAATGRTSLGATTVGGNLFTLANPSAITFPRLNADNTVSALDAATFRTAIGAGTSSTTGTVTSVGLSLPAIFSVTNSPITTSGTLTGSLATQTANTVFSGPTTGAAAAPTFRSLVAADIPTLNQNTTGTSANVTGIVGLANGGTAANLTAVNGGVLYSTASALAISSAGTSGQLLQSNGAAAPSWVASPGVPTGSLFPYAGSTAPTGYLLCDGSAVARTGTYAALFAVIGTTYGSGDGSTTFNLPDLRGRLPLGAGTGVGLNASGTGKPSGTAQTARTAGQWGGEETNLLTTNEMPSHNHNGVTGNAGSHSHTLNKEVLTYMGSGGNRYDPYPGSVWAGSPVAGLTISTVADHSHTVTAQGGGARHNTMPPFIVANYIIKT